MQPDTMLEGVRRRVEMVSKELARLAEQPNPALRALPAETLRMHLEMAAQDMDAYVSALAMQDDK